MKHGVVWCAIYCSRYDEPWSYWTTVPM